MTFKYIHAVLLLLYTISEFKKISLIFGTEFIVIYLLYYQLYLFY